MSHRIIFVSGVVSLGLALAFGIQVLLGLSKDHYWTPMALAPDLLEARDKVVMYMNGKPVPISTHHGHIRLRFNNKGKVTCTRLIPVAFFGAAGLALLSASLVQKWMP